MQDEQAAAAAPHLLHPRLVPLEPRLVELEGVERRVVLRDPYGVAEPVVVAPVAYALLALFDGRPAAGVAAAAEHQGLRGVDPGQVLELARQADAAGLLQGPGREARLAARLAEFRAGPRPPTCAGGVYPEEEAILRDQLASFFIHPDGPGSRVGRSRSGEGARLLVAPHIDYQRGGPTYAHAYRALEGCDAELFVVFGTAHASPPHLFTLTRQDYQTPFGPVATDRSVVNALVAELSEEELLADELAHAGEHSCELQLVWLRWALGDRPFRALPVLCSSTSHLRDPRRATAPFLDALARATAGRRVCFVASADLAHVGPQYGDLRPPTAGELEALAGEDRTTLAHLEAGDAEAFFRDAVRDEARRRLCGVAPIYAAMRAAGRGAQILHHGQWSDGTDSVSFAAAIG